MDGIRIRSMIAGSIARHNLEHRRRYRRPPTDFGTFRRMVSLAVENSSNSPTLAEVFHVDDSSVFTPLWDTWVSIDSELKECRSRNEAIGLWHDAVDFYMPTLIESILATYDLIDGDNSLSEAVKLTLKNNVS